ncbi:MAG: serine hydroxymethyltransferase [Patescibacteria group bacterium]
MKDKILHKLIKQEEQRQEETISLIASENYASPEVLDILGSVLVNKYSEGYPGRRYYPGNEVYDKIENLARERVLKLFGLSDKEWHVNVQPYSGSPANLAVYAALLDFGDKIMGMRLAAGGHLTHGHKVNFSGRAYKAFQYGVEMDTGLLDYVDLERLANHHKPKLITSGTTAYPREIDFKRISKVARKIGAYHLADISHIAGLVATGLHQSPFENCDVVTTTTHKTLRGPRGAVIICRKELAKRIDRSVFPGMQGGPHNNQTAAIALMAFVGRQKSFQQYQKQIIKNAKVLANELMKVGFDLVTGGTDNHLILVDLRPTGHSGKNAERLLEKAGIIANRNSIPSDTSPFNPSGLRLGTPAVTTRGMKEKEMKKIASWITDLLLKKAKPTTINRQIKAICKKFPIL